MDATKVQFVGASCGQHGPYTFYKAFKYHKDEKPKILSLGEFFFVEILKGAPVSIGELQLIWEDKNNNQLLASVRLYFLPEHTPDGKQEYHGEDEILALSEKLILRLDDLVSLITDECPYWTAGRLLFCERDIEKKTSHGSSSLLQAFQTNNCGLQLSDVNKAKETIGQKETKDDAVKVVVMSFAQYCRYRSIMKRLEHVQDQWLKHTIVSAIGGITSPTHNCHVMFCRDTFFHPELEEFELRCDHFAPNLKGRPRKKKSANKGSTQDSDSYEEESDSSIHQTLGGFGMSASSISLAKQRTRRESCKNGIRWNRNTTREEQHFLASLHKFMRNRQTPIDRVPNLGFKQINLYLFYVNAKKLGGYEEITKKRLWKSLYDMMGGHASSTSAATCTRRHYEKLLLPFERHENGDGHKPFPSSLKKKLHFVRGLMHKHSSDTVDSKSQAPLKVKEKLEMKVKQDAKAKQMSKEPTDVKVKSDEKSDIMKTKKRFAQSKQLAESAVEDKERKWNEIRKKCALQRDKLKKITHRNTVKKMLDKVSSGEDKDDTKDKIDNVQEVKTETTQPEQSRTSPETGETTPQVVQNNSVVTDSSLMQEDAAVKTEKESEPRIDVPCVKQRIKPSIMSPLIQRRGQQKVSKTQEQYPAMRTPSMYYASQFQLAAPTYLGHSVLGGQTGSGLGGLRNSLYRDQSVVSVASSSAGSLSESQRNSVLPGLDRSRPSVIQPTPKAKVAPFVGSQLFQNPSSEVMSPSLKPAHSNSSKRSYPYMDALPPPSPHLLPSQHFSKHPPSISKASPSPAYTNNVFLAPSSTKRSRFEQSTRHHSVSVQDEPIDLSVKTNSHSELAILGTNPNHSVLRKSPHIPPFNLSTSLSSSNSSLPYSIDLTSSRASMDLTSSRTSMDLSSSRVSMDLSTPGKDTVSNRAASLSVVPSSYHNTAGTGRSKSDATKLKSQDTHSASFSPSQRPASAAPLLYTKTSNSNPPSSSSTYQEVLSPNLHPAFPSSSFMPSNVIVTSPLQLQQLYAARFSSVHAAAYEEMVRQQLYAQLNSGTSVAAPPMQIYPHLYKESQKSGATK
ncbi:AT-rich interactive domain-containing protein 5B-like isoform X2 [Gigantopelta aegis]|uniref:AT-rich interactive domain-containing protein 5B-like isoform X2 n=1 Tax=Gigantopelta aegis TaxID=1735272 RepID=UPI001B88A754|nr:AT-rich interactive domain-containing protein 5B-like isoform X2 [Gigantopelta aegis]